MLKLCGFRISNYHNKVRLVLLEKGIAFEEDDSLPPRQTDEYLARSPMGKAPFLELVAHLELHLEELPQVKPYLAMLGERPAFRRVNEDRKAATRK